MMHCNQGGMEGILRGMDVKLNVQLVYVALIHEHAYEGPCRFGPPEALTKEFDLLNQAEIFKGWSGAMMGAFSQVPGINMLPPVYLKMSDEFFVPAEEEAQLLPTIRETDLYIFTGMRCEGYAKEFAIRYNKPVAGEGMFASTIINAITRARGAEAYAFLDIPDGIRLLNALRTRKALRNTRILAVVRNNSQQSLGGPDAFLSNDDATHRLGINFTYLSIHEFLDMLHVDESGKNYTLPGRNACNLTSEDMVEVERWTDELMAGTDDIKSWRDNHGHGRGTAQHPGGSGPAGRPAESDGISAGLRQSQPGHPPGSAPGGRSGPQLSGPHLADHRMGRRPAPHAGGQRVLPGQGRAGPAVRGIRRQTPGGDPELHLPSAGGPGLYRPPDR